MAKYYDKLGAPIDFESYKEKRKDPNYKFVELYDNQKVRLSIEWLGKVPQPDIMRDYWPLFQVNVHNGIPQADGSIKWAEDGQSGAKFGRVEDARKAYQEFLVEWTECEMKETKGGVMKFVEADNIHEMPAPPDLNTPVSEIAIGEGGVW